MTWRDRLFIGFAMVGLGLQLNGFQFGGSLIAGAGAAFVWHSFKDSN